MTHHCFHCILKWGRQFFFFPVCGLCFEIAFSLLVFPDAKLTVACALMKWHCSGPDDFISPPLKVLVWHMNQRLPWPHLTLMTHSSSFALCQTFSPSILSLCPRDFSKIEKCAWHHNLLAHAIYNYILAFKSFAPTSWRLNQDLKPISISTCTVKVKNIGTPAFTHWIL